MEKLSQQLSTTEVPSLDTSERKGRFKVTNIDVDSSNANGVTQGLESVPQSSVGNNSNISSANSEGIIDSKQTQDTAKPKKSRFTVKSGDEVSSSVSSSDSSRKVTSQDTAPVRKSNTPVSTSGSSLSTLPSTLGCRDSVSSTQNSTNLKKTTRFIVRDASDSSININTKSNPKSGAEVASDSSSNISNNIPIINPSDSSLSKKGKSRFTVKTISNPSSTPNSTPRTSSSQIQTIDSNCATRLQSMIEANYQMLANIQKELQHVPGVGNMIGNYASAIPSSSPQLVDKDTHTFTSVMPDQTSHAKQGSGKDHCGKDSNSNADSSSKQHSLGKLSHYINEMKKEVDMASKHRRESNLETQRLREKCLHLEDLLIAANNKNALLEERLEKSLNKQRSLQGQLDNLMYQQQVHDKESAVKDSEKKYENLQSVDGDSSSHPCGSKNSSFSRHTSSQS